MRRSVAVVAASLLAAGCGNDPPGTLTLTLDALPSVTREGQIIIAGSISRAPTRSTLFTVQAMGGASPASDTTRTNRFTLRVNLALNAANQITISATDTEGSTGETRSVAIRHDDLPPAVAQVTPADVTDDVAAGGTVQVTMSEPVVVTPAGGVRIVRQGVALAGATALSGDSLTLTFTPAAPLPPNAVLRVSISGLADVAGNAAGGTFGSCFATAPAGATASAVFSDSTDDLFRTELDPDLGPPPLPPDLVAVRFAREGPLFSGIVRFVGPRSFSLMAADHGNVYVDLDVDQDSTTGYVTLKDSAFTLSPSLGPTYSSGIRAEYLVGLEPLPSLGDLAYVGRYVDAFQFEVLGTFLPDVCGPLMAFVVPFSALGDDEGQMNVLVLGIAETAAQLILDPAPTRGHLTVDLRTPPGVPPWTAPGFVARTDGRRFRLRPQP